MEAVAGQASAIRNPGLWFLIDGPILPSPAVVGGLFANAIIPESEADTAGTGDKVLATVISGGLTFDLTGCVIDRARLRADGAARSDLAPLSRIGATQAVVVRPGPHIASVAAAPIVVRGMATVGEVLARRLSAVARIYWPPSGWSTCTEEYVRTAGLWTESGAFPGPGIIQFRPAMGGALQSSGLAHFTGQELRIEGDLAPEGQHDRQRADRLAADLAVRSRVTSSETYHCALGTSIRIAPSANGRYVRASLA